MDKFDRTMQQRIHAHKAEAELNAVLEYFLGHDENKDYRNMAQKVTAFFKWIWDESPIA